MLRNSTLRPLVLCCVASAGLVAQSPSPSAIGQVSGPPGTNVSVTGSNLRQSGYRVRVGYLKKYVAAGESRTAYVSSVTDVSNTQLTFPAPPNAQPDQFFLVYDPIDPRQTSGFRSPFRIPDAFHVLEPPVITGPFALSQGSTAAALLRAGVPLTLVGRNLVPPPGGSVTLRIQGLTVAVSGATYSAGANGGLGGDQITLTAPSVSSTVTGDAAFTFPGGSLTLPYWVIARRATVTGLERSSAPGVPVSALLLGQYYHILGTDLVYTLSSGGSLKGRVVLQGGSTTDMDIGIGLATRLQVRMPQASSLTQATMRLISWAGDTVTVGTYPIQDPAVAAPPPLQTFIVSPSPATGGASVTATIGFAGSIDPSVNVGDLTISSVTSGLISPRTVPITSNPLIVSLPTNMVSSALSGSVKVRLNRFTGVTDSLTAPLQLNPVRLLAFSRSTDTVTGGRALTINATFDLSNLGTCGLFNNGGISLTVTSSDTAVAKRTTGIPTCIDQSPATVYITTRRQVAPRSVTLTGTLNATSVPYTVNVLPPSAVGVRVKGSGLSTGGTLKSLARDTLEVVLADSLPGNLLTVTSSDASVTIPTPPTGSQQYFWLPVIPNAVTTSRQVSVTATTTSGYPRTFAFTLNPLSVTAMSLTPSTISGATKVAGTITLSHAAANPITIALTSSDPSAATLPASVQLVPGQTAAVFSVQGQAGGTQPRTVTITATLSTPGGDITRSATLTVNP